MHEILSIAVGVVLFLLVTFILYWDLWNVEEQEDDDRDER